MNIQPILVSAREASFTQDRLDDAAVGRALCAVADEIDAQAPRLLAANADDLARMSPDNPKYDRLKLTAGRLHDIAADMRRVAALPSPLGRILQHDVRPNGMELTRVSVPFGVIGVIYEARPNVTFDVFALCLKAGSACVLKGGSDARSSNAAAISLIRDVLRRNGLDPNWATLLPFERECTDALLRADDYIDLLIPRGSASLIRYVRQHATVPVIETGAGVCHTYFDRAGDADKGAAVIFNAKTRRVSVCNALDCLLVHRERLADLPSLCRPLADKRVTIYADADSFRVLRASYPEELLQRADGYGTEFGVSGL